MIYLDERIAVDLSCGEDSDELVVEGFVPYWWYCVGDRDWLAEPGGVTQAYAHHVAHEDDLAAHLFDGPSDEDEVLALEVDDETEVIDVD